MQSVRLPVCAACGEAAELLVLPRAHRPFTQRLGGLWRRPLQGEGRLELAALGLVTWALSRLGLYGALFAQALLWSYVFARMQGGARGRDDTGTPPDFGRAGLYGAGLRGLLASCVLWLPAALYAGLGPFADAPWHADRRAEAPAAARVGVAPAQGAPEHAVEGATEGAVEGAVSELLATPDSLAARGVGELDLARAKLEGPRGLEALHAAKARPGLSVTRALRDPTVWGLLLLGLLWAPAALVAAATAAVPWRILNPLAPVAMLRRVPRASLTASALLLGLALAQGLALLLARRLQSSPLPLLPGLVGSALVAYVPLVAGHAMGRFLYVHGAELGSLPRDEGFEPALPGVEPRAADPGPPAATAPHRSHAPLELEEAPPPPPAPVRVQRTVLDPAALPPQTAPEEDALARAIAVRDAARVVALYREELAAGLARLDAASHLAVGLAAASLGEDRLAASALQHACAAAPRDAPVAPRAHVLLGRILAERLGDAVGARRVYAQVVQRYPGTEAARFAASQLGAGGLGGD